MLDSKIEKHKLVSIFVLINKYFWKTKVGPIFSTTLPFLFMIMYFALSNNNSSSSFGSNSFVNGLPTYISMSIIPLSIITLPSMLIEFKNSIILRKIKTCGLNELGFNGLCLIYFFIASISFTLITMIIFLLFSINKFNSLNFINWGTLIFGIIFLIFLSISFGLLLSTFIKTGLSAQLIGFAIFLLTLCFSGQFMPLSLVGSVDALKYMSLLSPLNYATNILNIASVESVGISTNSLFDFNNPFIIFGISKEPGNKPELLLYDIWQKVLFIVMPIVLFISFEILSIKFFKWTGR